MQNCYTQIFIIIISHNRKNNNFHELRFTYFLQFTKETTKIWNQESNPQSNDLCTFDFVVVVFKAVFWAAPQKCFVNSPFRLNFVAALWMAPPFLLPYTELLVKYIGFGFFPVSVFFCLVRWVRRRTKGESNVTSTSAAHVLFPCWNVLILWHYYFSENIILFKKLVNFTCVFLVKCLLCRQKMLRTHFEKRNFWNSENSKWDST